MNKMLKILLPCLVTLSICAKKENFDPEQILAKLSLRNKIAQLCIVAAVSNEEKNKKLMERWDFWAGYHLDHAYIENLIKNYHIGGIIFYGDNTAAQEQEALTKHFQSLSDTPLFIALDAETGLHYRLDEETVADYPCAMALGATRDPQYIYKLGLELGKQLKRIGVHIAFSPVVDVNNNPQNPVIGLRSFGSDKRLVALMGIALMRGLQEAGIIACAKHFPGHGDTHADSHAELPKINHDKQHFEDIELYPFRKLIKAGVKSIMLAHLEIPALEKQKGLASSLSKSITTRLLQKKMGFRGLIITDALGMKGASDCAELGELELKALLAGNDILLCPVDTAKAIDYIEQAVHEGKISEDEINRKVLKVLHAKAWAFSQVTEDEQPLQEVLQSSYAKELQETLYAKAITLAKSSTKNPFNHDNSQKMIIAIHEFATDKNQFTNSTEIPVHTLSLEEWNKTTDAWIKEEVTADHVIVSIHCLKRYADIGFGVTDSMKELITQLKAHGKQVTVVLFGSPYAIPKFKEADNILVAYENWPAAQKAVADIISGKKVATGCLPVQVN